MILGRVGPQPADGRLAIFDLCRKDGVLAQAVIDARHGKVLGGKANGRAIVLAAGPPCSAVDPHDHRQWLRGFFRQVEIQAVPLVAIFDISQIAQRLDPFRHVLGRTSLRRLPRGPGDRQQ